MSVFRPIVVRKGLTLTGCVLIFLIIWFALVAALAVMDRSGLSAAP